MTSRIGLYIPICTQHYDVRVFPESRMSEFGEYRFAHGREYSVF